MNLFSSEIAIVVIFFIPFIISLVALYRSMSGFVFTGLVFAAGVTNLLLLSSVEGQTSIDLGGGFVFSLDKYSQLFVILVNVCWMVTSLYSLDYLKYNFPEKSHIFQFHLSLAVAAVLGTGMSENMWTLGLFYTLSGLSILPLLTKFKFKEQKIKTIYTLNVLLPPIVTLLPVSAFLGILFIPFDQLHIKDIGLSDWQNSMLLAGFVIFFSKNCVMPFHLWLPRSSFAPAPVSALVHTVGAVQTGTIAILKIGHYAYGDQYLYELNDSFLLTGWITYLLGATAIYTAYRAWKTTNLKERFSFSTVGQLSYILTAILIGTPGAHLGAILHIITHSLAKMTLFFNAGIFSTSFKSTETYEVGKIAPALPWVIASSGIAGLSITGFPLLAGYYSKDLMLIEEIQTHHYAAALFLLFGSFINFLYIYPIIKAGFWPYIQKYILGQKIEFPRVYKDLKLSMVLATSLTTGSVILFSQYIYLVVWFLRGT